MNSPIDYVVDTSVVIQHLINDEHTPQADSLFEGIETTVVLHVPEFCLVECVNVLWKRVRFHGLPAETAAALLDNLVALPIRIAPVAAVFPRALQIGLANQLAIYDSVYIALAEWQNYSLITDDRRQEVAARATGVAVKPLADFSS